MTTPNLPPDQAPDGAYVIGGGDWKFGSLLTPDLGKAFMTQGILGSYTTAQNTHKSEVRDRIDGAYEQIEIVSGDAATAISEAQAAANAAAAAESTAATAYQAASYWEAEFVAASAAVVLGVNELLIGLCQNVPLGLVRKVTDIHVAFLSQPNGLTFQLKKWNPAGTSDSVLDTFTLTANQTRANWSITGGYEVTNRERLFINVTSVTGSTAPVVFQILVFGVLYDPAIQTP
ncbi:hypothetical protein [Nocardia abscessus]|uniref:hypothetical protein n=1 Tax=Nocardia abscessus TaxID=120957 RepID=UPI002458F336|nr:hypothetical protein [Nocardia abscessus]